MKVESLFLASAPCPKILAADIGYDARWLRQRLRTKGFDRRSKNGSKGKKPKGRPIKEIVPRYQHNTVRLRDF